MHYVLLRDDDTSALTDPGVLERIYGPLLDRGLPVHLSVIPNVNTRSTLPDGSPEWYLPNDTCGLPEIVPVGDNAALVSYLRQRRGYGIVQHGFEHRFQEFRCEDRRTLDRWIEQGRTLIAEAGLPPPSAFVAPQDRLSGQALVSLAEQFGLVSTCWFERGQIPARWWASYAVKKLARHPHWRVGRCTMLSHPGSLLTHTRDYATLVERLQRSVRSRRLTVVVTHWWEYFRRERFDAPLLAVMHEVGEWLATAPDVRVVTVDDVASGRVPLA